MTIAFQLAVFALIVTSLILLISVPVVFASSDGWSSKKKCCIFWYIIMDWISLSGGYAEFSHLLNFFGIFPIQKYHFIVMNWI
uniref:Photosystem II reaction center protein Z n=1 Tax=Corallorhiza maculata TaxID=48526 RepID=A0A6G7KZ53_9ASPA|nr:photosystem II subunit Z [Corallorhiza maculata]QII90629.1 photosystem II subunit Z [Corallorhiza maculata]